MSWLLRRLASLPVAFFFGVVLMGDQQQLHHHLAGAGEIREAEMELHHVQVSMPQGQEDEARRFYGKVLGLSEVEKPASLAGRGGCWFRAYDGDLVVAEIHLGVEDPFHPADKAHPGLVCDTLTELEALASRIEQAGYELSWQEQDTFEGYSRFHARDGFGNRIEVLAPISVEPGS